MHGSPNAGFALSMILLLATILISIVGAGLTVLYLFVDRKLIRNIYKVTAILLAVVLVALLVFDPALWMAYLLGRIAQGRIVYDFPVLALTRYASLLAAFVFLAPVLQRYLSRRSAHGR